MGASPQLWTGGAKVRASGHQRQRRQADIGTKVGKPTLDPSSATADRRAKVRASGHRYQGPRRRTSDPRSAIADTVPKVRSCGQEGVMITYGVEGSTRVDTLSSILRKAEKSGQTLGENRGYNGRHQWR